MVILLMSAFGGMASGRRSSPGACQASMMSEKVPGQVKLKGNWRGLRPPPLLSSPTAKELVPNTGVETLPKVQGPGETTAWKCLRQTRKKVRQPDSHGRPLASTPRSLANSCRCSWKTPEPAARYCTGTREGGRGAVSSANAGFRPRERREGRRGRGTLPAAKVPPATVAPKQRRYGTRLPFPGASLSPPARPEAGSVRDAASPCVHPPEESLKSQAPLVAFLPPRLLFSSTQIAVVGNPGEGGWAAAALRKCPRANPGTASRLVPGYSALEAA